MELLKIKSLKKEYITGNEKLEVLRDINLVINEGETVAITGESGSGKTTILNLAGGLDSVSGGRIIYNDKGREIDITQLTEEQLTGYRRDVIGFVFQFHFLLKDFTALENVMMPSYIAGRVKNKAYEQATKLIKDVGVEHRKDGYPSELSGGEKQRLSVARALMNEKKIIIADEPTGNLDERNSKIVEDLLFDVVDKYKRTLLLVTHDRTLAKRAQRHYELIHGVLVEK
jgi:lipoprotein-releasing system ATP-binding protein